MNSNITLLFTGKNISEKRRNRSINSSLIDLFLEENRPAQQNQVAKSTDSLLKLS